MTRLKRYMQSILPAKSRTGGARVIRRLGVMMSPEPGNPHEVMGVLNPGGAEGPDGQYYLFPRVVADDNYSRIGYARVVHDGANLPTGVEKLGYALEPAVDMERNGVEDARVTKFEPTGDYLMTYTAFNRAVGPRLALARSQDLKTWERLGLASCERENGWCPGEFDNKDALIFPQLVTDPHGKPAMAMIHRPDFKMTVPKAVEEARPSMWISYAAESGLRDGTGPHWRDHTLLARPEQAWEALKIGGGAPPVLIDQGWLVIYHGVRGKIIPELELQPDVHYSAGVMLLDRHDPRKVLYRSAAPILSPDTPQEHTGMVNNVVFPTALERSGDSFTVYYGMADASIGAAHFTLDQILPPA